MSLPLLSLSIWIPILGGLGVLAGGGDQTVIDGLMVNGSARVVGWFSGVVRLVQTGLLNTYAFLILFGILTGLTWMVWRYGTFLK